MKTLTYKYEDMQQAVRLINSLPFCGIQQARLIAELGDILDSGTVGEIIEKEESENGVHSKEVCTDKLEK